MAVDFWDLELKINYNNRGALADPNERQAGWTEKYDMPIALSITTARANALSLIAARAAVLAKNYYVFSASIHQASVFRSRYSVPGFAVNPITDAQFILSGNAGQACNDPEAAVLVRFESAALVRWERAFRGIKDYMANDSSQFTSDFSYGPSADGIDLVFPAIQPTGVNGGVEATLTMTNTAGVLSLPIIGAAGSGYLGTGAGYPLVFTDPTGNGNGAVGTFTLAGGVVTAVAITSGGAGYDPTTTIRAPLLADANGLQEYQAANTLWANLYAALAAYTGSGKRVRVANADLPAQSPALPAGTNPSGFVTLLSEYIATSRIIPQKIGNRQTGGINLATKARVKRGI